MMTITAGADMAPAFTHFDSSVIDYFVSLAGPEFEWSIIRGSRPGCSGYRKGLRQYLYTFQRSTCAFCGNYERLDYMEMCHIVPKRGMDAGYLPGNIALGCRKCNESHGDNVVPYSAISRPDLVAISWPSRRDCEALAHLT